MKRLFALLPLVAVLMAGCVFAPHHDRYDHGPDHGWHDHYHGDHGHHDYQGHNRGWDH